MPVIELDMLIALVNREDDHHEIASKIFNAISQGEIKNVAIAASALIEYELILRSRGYGDEDIAADIRSFTSIENMKEAPLTSEIILGALNLRVKYQLTYFDSLHAATAILWDGVIISADKAYLRVRELKAVALEEMRLSNESYKSRRI